MRDLAGGHCDAALAARHRHGDALAFALLHQRYAGGLRTHARRLVGTDPSEDVLQEAFERAHRFLMRDPRALSPDLALGPWLHVVVHRCCVDLLRTAATKPTVEGVEVPENGPTPHDRAVLAEQLAHLSAAVRALPVRQREALVRHVLNGESHATVAIGLEVSVAATKGLVNRARRELRESWAA